MDKVLIAVDDSKASLSAVRLFHELFGDDPPETTVLLHVEKIEGRSLMDAMLGEAELSTLKEELRGTRYQKMLDARAEKILAYFRREVEKGGAKGIKAVVREGHPADEILALSKEQGARLIIVGAKSKRLHGLFMGSVSRDVANRADCAVLVAR